MRNDCVWMKYGWNREDLMLKEQRFKMPLFKRL